MKGQRRKSLRRNKTNKKNKKLRRTVKAVKSKKFFHTKMRGGEMSDFSKSGSVVFMPRGAGCPRGPISKEQAAKLSEWDASDC